MSALIFNRNTMPSFWEGCNSRTHSRSVAVLCTAGAGAIAALGSAPCMTAPERRARGADGPSQPIQCETVLRLLPDCRRIMPDCRQRTENTDPNVTAERFSRSASKIPFRVASYKAATMCGLKRIIRIKRLFHR